MAPDNSEHVKLSMTPKTIIPSSCLPSPVSPIHHPHRRPSLSWSEHASSYRYRPDIPLKSHPSCQHTPSPRSGHRMPKASHYRTERIPDRRPMRQCPSGWPGRPATVPTRVSGRGPVRDEASSPTTAPLACRLINRRRMRDPAFGG